MKKITYRDLLTMLTKANDCYDIFWSAGLFREAIKYSKISNRIVKSMEKYNTNFVKV